MQCERPLRRRSVEHGERFAVGSEPDVGMEQATERLPNGKRPGEVRAAQRRCSRRQRTDPGEHAVELLRTRELLDAVLDVDRVHERLDHPERLRRRFPIAGIGQHGRRVADRDTTVKSLMVAEKNRLVEPNLEQVLTFCAEDPVERVFLEETAQRGPGRLLAAVDGPRVTALCHLGANVVPSGSGCDRFADAVASARPKMLIGNEAAVSALWSAIRDRMPPPRDDRPGQPVFAISEPPEPGESGIRPATRQDLDVLLPACAATHEGELGLDPLAADADGFRRRTLQQIDDGRSWIWIEDRTILFKAEASAWTPHAVQLQQVWVDPEVRSKGYGQRGLRDLVRLLLDRVPQVCLFVRADNPAAIRLYDAIGMARVGSYRSVLF
jgi:hypothetical protein